MNKLIGNVHKTKLFTLIKIPFFKIYLEILKQKSFSTKVGSFLIREHFYNPES